MTEESAWTAINDAGKRPLSAIVEDDEPNRLANPGEPLRKIIRLVPVMGATIEAEPERTDSEVNLSPPASDRLTVPNSPSRLTPDSHDLDPTVSKQAKVTVTKSAEYLLTIAPGSQPSEPR